MAIPKTLRPIDKESAQRLIVKYTKAGVGHWEGAKFGSDFVYKTNSGYKLIRPPCGPWGSYETGVVSM